MFQFEELDGDYSVACEKARARCSNCERHHLTARTNSIILAPDYDHSSAEDEPDKWYLQMRDDETGEVTRVDLNLDTLAELRAGMTGLERHIGPVDW